MVLPLRFPPGMAGGLLLAYPRKSKSNMLCHCRNAPVMI